LLSDYLKTSTIKLSRGARYQLEMHRKPFGDPAPAGPSGEAHSARSRASNWVWGMDPAAWRGGQIGTGWDKGRRGGIGGKRKRSGKG